MEVLVSLVSLDHGEFLFFKKVIDEFRSSGCENLQLSPIYLIKNGSKEGYVTLSCCVETGHSISEFSNLIFSLESEFSTVNEIFLLLFGDKIQISPKASIPYPDFHRKSFLLMPAAELRPGTVHPVLKKSLGELAETYLEENWGELLHVSNSLLAF